MHQLKKGQEGFRIVDGPDAGKTFERGKPYTAPPAGYENRFEKIRVPAEETKGKKGGK